MSLFGKTIRFYTKPFLIVSIVNLLIILIFGAYFEDYEGIFSAMVQGVYSKPVDMWFDTTNYFLILRIPELLLSLARPYNIYGLTLLVYNITCLTFAGLVLFRILRINFSNNSWVIFVLLYLVISMDNLINLNCTRHALVLIIALFALIESKRIEHRKISIQTWIYILLLMLLANLFRFEAALLIAVLYVALLVIFKRYSKYALLPVSLSVFFAMLFYVLVNQFSSEPVKVFIYKEKEITSRNNFDTAGLTAIQKLDVEAVRDYFITDKDHYSRAFYDSVAKYQPMSFFGAVNLNTFFSNLMISYMESIQSIFYLLFYLASGLLVWLKGAPRREFRWYFIAFLIIPFLLCFYTVIPSRFIDPYFGFLGCFNVLYSIRNKKMLSRMTWLCSIVIPVLLLKGFWTAAKYKDEDRKYSIAMRKLQTIGETYGGTIFINNFYSDNYFPVTPFSVLEKKNIRFLNFYLFNAWDFQREDWTDICHCNSFSLPEKIKYIIDSKSVFLVDEYSWEFMKRYLKVKHNIEVARKDKEKFNEYLTVCYLSYAEK